MDKQQVIDAFVAQFREALASATTAAWAAHGAATDGESRAENKYDTRGLEASYLARAQSNRVAEAEAVLDAYRRWSVHPPPATEHAAVGSLVTLQSADGSRRRCLLGPKGGGAEVTLSGNAVQLVTLPSPLGRALVGKRVGETLTLPGGLQLTLVGLD